MSIKDLQELRKREQELYQQNLLIDQQNKEIAHRLSQQNNSSLYQESNNEFFQNGELTNLDVDFDEFDPENGGELAEELDESQEYEQSNSNYHKEPKLEKIGGDLLRQIDTTKREEEIQRIRDLDEMNKLNSEQESIIHKQRLEIDSLKADLKQLVSEMEKETLT